MTSETRWSIRNENLVTRGNVKELPAAVLTLTEAESAGPDVPAFWEAMGMEFVNESIREGLSFRIESGDQIVTVSVVKLLKLREQGNLETVEEVSPGFRLVEVVCRVPTGSYTLGVEAIDKLKELLKDYTELRKG